MLSGGRQIIGWRPSSTRAGLWEADIANADQWNFHSLFVNGQRRQRARTPNQGFFTIQGKSPATSPVQFQYRPGDIKPEWASNGTVEVIALVAWADLRMQIKSVNQASNTVVLSGVPRGSLQEDNARYDIENAPDALDQPGEWYLDRAKRLVTYWPLSGEDPTQAQIVAPVLPSLLFIKGDFDKGVPVTNLTLRGLTFAYADWTLDATGYTGDQAEWPIHGDVQVTGAHNCTFDQCTFTHLGSYALELGRGCQNVSVTENLMSDLGAGGIRMGDSFLRIGVTSFDACERNVVSDNRINNCGLVYPSGAGILVMFSARNEIAHNEIDHLYYTGISVGWIWGYQTSPCASNIVEFNDIHDIGQGMLSDMGGIYTLGPQPGTIIRSNKVHDVKSSVYGGWGLYADQGSSYILWDGNLVYNTSSEGFFLHFGQENIVRNNLFAFGNFAQLRREVAQTNLCLIFTNNIVYYNSGNLLNLAWPSDNSFVMDYNIYWDARPGASIKFVNSTLSQWRQRGYDQNSVIADPGFVDPARLNFNLSAISPAINFGFKTNKLVGFGWRFPAPGPLIIQPRSP